MQLETATQLEYWDRILIVFSGNSLDIKWRALHFLLVKIEWIVDRSSIISNFLHFKEEFKLNIVVNG
jgi:hypothetical protein